MSDELQLYSETTGRTIIAKVFSTGATAAQVGGDISCPEIGSTAVYSGDMPAADLGTYVVRFYDGGILVGGNTIGWDGAQEVSPDSLQLVESGYSLLDSARLWNAVLLGKVSGAGTGTETFRDIGDTKDRVVATVDSSGNRTAITLDEV